jgi:hypothetical protein
MDNEAILKEYSIDPFIAFKFHKREYNQDTMDGRLYLNNIEFFRKLEEEQNEKRGIADKEDSCFVIQNGTIMVLGENHEWKHVVDFQNGREELCSNYLLFCLYSLGREDIDEVYLSDDGKFINVAYRFTDTQKRDIKDHFQDADSVLVISNGNFLINIKRAAEKKGSKITGRKVVYRNNSHETEEYRNSRAENPQNMVFYKDKFFESQKEFRILFEPMELRDGHYLYFEKVQNGMYLIDIEQAVNGKFIVQYAIT